MDLLKRSIEIILANQHPSGAYVASPNFPTYRYCWFRDASFVAYAMDLVGEQESAASFHTWAARALNERAGVVGRALEKAARGLPLAESDPLDTRLTLEGLDGTQEEWTNFQLDGFGTWLWALNEHRKRGAGPLPADWLQAAGLAAAYLAGLWRLPNFDCWEEFSEFIHPHTLAAICGGLKAYSEITSAFANPKEETAAAKAGLSAAEALAAAGEIKAYIEDHFVFEGHFVKFSGAPAVDASLLGLAVPYGVFALDDPRLIATVAEIERSLSGGAGEGAGAPRLSGVHRYRADTYYGGGEWVLLTAWLGWYYAEGGAYEQVGRILKWIEAQADGEGFLPEQVLHNLNDPSYYQPWVKRWGPVASPLLWSHAKYIILKQAAGR